eukprot:TRINITY_DN27776_c0_g1_i1.p1 TRINITY_DN27776_c0_g1~~TRINITY_DN27776_c0_g1_i1.p1  ORF type:complete len:983 (-),score=192.33 TRINITY_DN27776_c0_g1_i1:50-2998(-)
MTRWLTSTKAGLGICALVAVILLQVQVGQCTRPARDEQVTLGVDDADAEGVNDTIVEVENESVRAGAQSFEDGKHVDALPEDITHVNENGTVHVDVRSSNDGKQVLPEDTAHKDGQSSKDGREVLPEGITVNENGTAPVDAQSFRDAKQVLLEGMAHREANEPVQVDAQSSQDGKQVLPENLTVNENEAVHVDAQISKDGEQVLPENISRMNENEPAHVAFQSSRDGKQVLPEDIARMNTQQVAALSLSRTLHDIFSTFNAARGAEDTGGEEGVEDMSWLTPRDIQRIKIDNNRNDFAEVLIFLAVNLSILVLTVLLILCLPTEVYCPRRVSDNQKRLVMPWRRHSQELDETLMQHAGFDGLVLIRFLRLGTWVCIMATLFNTCVLSSWHFAISPDSIYSADCSVTEEVANPVPVTERSACVAAQLQLEKTHSVTFEDGHCHALAHANVKGERHSADQETQKDVCKTHSLGIVQRLSMRSALAVEGKRHSMLWLDTLSIVYVTCITLYALDTLLKEFSKWRQLYMLSSPARTTVFVQNVPGDIDAASFKAYFEGLFPGCVLSTHLVQCTEARVAHVRPTDGTTPCFAPCGFVSFKLERDAHLCSQANLCSKDSGAWRAEMAPEPSELLWRNLQTWPNLAWKVLCQMLFWMLFVFWVFPVGFLSVTANIDNLEAVPGLKDVIRTFRENHLHEYTLINGNLSAISMAVFSSSLPYLLYAVNLLAGHPAQRFIDAAVERQFFMFLFFYVLILTAVSQSFFAFVQEVVAHPPEALKRIAQGLPRGSTWYMTYLLVTLAGLASVILRPFQLVWWAWRRLNGAEEVKESYMEELDESIGTTACRWSFYLCIALVYSTMSPMILPVAALAFLAAVLIYRYQLLCVLSSSHDTGGFFLLNVVQNLYMGLGAYHVAMLGLLACHEDTLYQSAIIFMCLIASVTFNSRHMEQANYTALPLDTLESDSLRKKELGIYEPPSEQKAAGEAQSRS